MKFNSIAQSSLVVLSPSRPHLQLRRRGTPGALLHRGERRLWHEWWHDFHRAQLFFSGGEQMHTVVGLHQDRFHRHPNDRAVPLAFPAIAKR